MFKDFDWQIKSYFEFYEKQIWQTWKKSLFDIDIR